MADDSDSGEKTEQPSQYKLDETRRKGEVASSKELNSVLILAGVFFTLTLSSVYIYECITNYIEWLYSIEMTKAYTEEAAREILKKTIWVCIKCVAPVFSASFCLGILTQLMQIGFIFAPNVLELKFDRVNPLAGFKRLFSKKAIVEVIKGIFKFVLVVSITYWVVEDNLSSFTGFLHSDVAESLTFGKVIALKLAMSILLGLLILALSDFAWEKYSHKQKLMMTKQQVKEESKDKDGNPEVKQKIKSLQREMSQNRMMSDIPKADVIVTNPTHISVALKYDPTTMIAPQVIAKGQDFVAMKIRELAKENDIPIVENIPLARAMYKTVKVGEGAPRSLYKAIAEILAYVYKQKRRKKALS